MTDNKALIDLTGEGIIFYHVALLRGFRAAATHLGLSKSVVSSKVSSLEGRLGCKLLFRSTRDVNLTTEGEIYFESCRELFAASQRLRQSEIGTKAGLSGTFTISAPHDFVCLCLTPILHRLQTLYPKLRLNVMSSDQVLNLEKSKIDLAIRVGAEGAKHLYRNSFFDVDFGFYTKAGTAPARKSEQEILEWMQEEGVFAFRPSREKSFKLNNRDRDVRIQSRFQVHDVLSLRSLILSGAGVGILPHFAAKADVAEGRLVQLLPSAEFKKLHYHFLSGKRRQEDPRLNAMIEFLVDESKNF